MSGPGASDRPADAEEAARPRVPEPFLGLWRREQIFTPSGFRDASTRVLWLQTGSYYADIRIAADRPSRPGAVDFNAFDEEELIRLAASQGFAGTLAVSGDTCLWRRDLDYAPPGEAPDEARFEIDGEAMSEFGLHADYTEIWRREPESARPTFAFRPAHPDPAGLLVTAGDHFIEIRARALPLPKGASLAEIVRTDLKAGRRDLAAARLDMRVCYGRIQGGGRPWRIGLSTLPWLEDVGLFEHDAPFDPRTGVLGLDGEAWILVDAAASRLEAAAWLGRP